jgi:hypothetical protein
VCDRFVVAAEAELSAAPPGRTARLVLDLGYADAQVAAVTRDLAQGVLSHIKSASRNSGHRARRRDMVMIMAM